MFLLPFIEERLGAVALWPTYVLHLLFIDGPTLLCITALAAFFYGNGIPINAAMSLYLTCHGYNDVSFVIQVFQHCYDEWKESPDRPVTFIYFNTEERLYRFVNGPVLEMLEEFAPIGFDSHVERTPEVEEKLETARRCPYPPGASYCVLVPRTSSARRTLFPEQ
jgi:hypothetical protein